MAVSKKKLITIRWVFFLNIVLFHCSFSNPKESTFPRNVELLSLLIDRVAHTAVERLELTAGDSVCIACIGENNKMEQFVCDRFCRVFWESGVRLFFSKDSIRDGTQLSLGVWEASVKYEKYLGRNLFKRGRILRRAELKLSLKSICSRTGQLVWADDLMDHVEDQVPVSHLDDIEEGSTVLGHPVLPEEEGLRRWFEPVFVLGVIGAVTYLFYWVRSS